MTMMTKAKRLLPIGMQDFANIRQRGHVYVDKTAHVHELVTGSGGAILPLPPPPLREIAPLLDARRRF
jgi:hypothetical protein